MSTTITVLGTGYVGLTTAALFAHSDYKVFAVEPNKERLDVIKQGRSFFFEEGLDPIVKSAIDNGNLVATDSYKESIPHSQIVFSAVGTPDNPDGSSNLNYVFGAAEEAASLLGDGAIYVQKSTVPVGTGEQVKEFFARIGKDIEYVSNPEFLREGTALEDTLFFDRVVVGGDDNKSLDTVLNIYRDLENKRRQIAQVAGIEFKDIEEGEYIKTSLNSAELIKVTSNAFLALKISFANSIAKLADAADADIKDVMYAVGADKRIGRAFLNAGRGYGGGCFPKDVSGLISSAQHHGVDIGIMQAAAEVNSEMPGYIAEKLRESLDDETFAGKNVTVLGLSFKSGTSDTRKSPGVALANLIAKAGANVKAYDPEGNEEAKEDLSPKVILTESIEEALGGSEIILVTTDWPVFKSYPLSEYKKQTGGQYVTFVDAMNSFDPASVNQAGMKYIGVGRR